MRLVLALFMFLAASSASADWFRSETKDAMRGTSIISYHQTISSLTESRSKLDAVVLENVHGYPAVIFNVSGGRVSGCDDGGTLCDINVKFDDGSVRSELFDWDGRSLSPINNVAFVAAMAESKVLFVELNILGEGARQYKVDTSGLSVDVGRGPDVSILGYQLGKKSAALPANMKKYGEEGDRVCFSSENTEGVFGHGKVKSVALCFYRNQLYLALIVPGTKESYVSGINFLNSRFGSYDKTGIYPRWPRGSGKKIETNTKSASYMSAGKSDYSLPFVISDDVLSLLVPEQGHR